MVTSVTSHANALQHPARAEEVALIVARKVTPKRSVPTNELLVPLAGLVVSARWRDTLQEIARPSQQKNAVTAARKVGGSL